MNLLTNFHFSIWGLFIASSFFVGLPYFFPSPNRRTTTLFTAVASGALIGIFFFDLIPFFFRDMPLRQRLLLLSALPIFYLLHRRLHRHHAGHGHHEPQVCQDSSWDPLFWGFMLAHSFLDGFFLRLSFRYSPYLVQVSIVTLILHRATEALFLATLGTAVRRYARRRSLFAYLVAFPAGAYTLDFFLTHPEIMQLSTYSLSIAAGSVMTLTLLGLLVCLLSDSLLPAWQKSQGSHPESRWSLLGVMAGFLLTFCFFKLGFLV